MQDYSALANFVFAGFYRWKAEHFPGPLSASDLKAAYQLYREQVK